MENLDKKKIIKSLTLMAVFNGLGAILFLTAFYLAKIQAFLWAGLFVLIFTVIAMLIMFRKVMKL